MTATAQRAVTYDHLKSKKKPATRSVRIALDSEVLDEFEEARGEKELAEMLVKAGGASPEQLQELEQATSRYRQAKDAMLKNSVRFQFRAIGRKKYDALLLAHPPTQAQKEDYVKQGGDSENDLNWNSDTFPPALVAACIVEPELTPEQVTEMFESEEWSGPEVFNLFQAAWQLNTASRVVDLGKD